MSDWGGQGGAGVPAGGGGPLREIAFTAEEESNLRAMARYMGIAGILLIVTALFQTIAQLVKAFVAPLIHHMPNQVTTGRGAGMLCGALIGIGLAALLGGALITAGRAFKRVVDSNDADQANLADGFRKLRLYFLVKGVLFIAMFLLCCLGLMFGAAAAAMLAR